MSGATLRKAAAKVRELAEAATPGPWLADVLGFEGCLVREVEGKPRAGSRIPRPVRVARCGYEDWDTDKGNAAYIATMSPGVGLALADWLDTAGADLWAYGPLCCTEGCMECDDYLWMPHVRRALAVAHQILGEA